MCANCWKYFCQECLDIWLKKRVDCPHCRVSFLVNGVKKAYNFKDMILKASYYDYMMNFVNKIGLRRKAKCQTICSKHDNCYMSKYCLDCRQCVCNNCAMSNEHSGHKFKSINRGYMYHLIKIVNNLPLLKDRASSVLTEVSHPYTLFPQLLKYIYSRSKICSLMLTRCHLVKHVYKRLNSLESIGH